MIKSFGDEETQKIYCQKFSRKLPVFIQKTALRKLMLIDSASNLADLRIPPGNCLESLRGDLEGKWSIKNIGLSLFRCQAVPITSKLRLSIIIVKEVSI